MTAGLSKSYPRPVELYSLLHPQMPNLQNNPISPNPLLLPSLLLQEQNLLFHYCHNQQDIHPVSLYRISRGNFPSKPRKKRTCQEREERRRETHRRDHISSSTAVDAPEVVGECGSSLSWPWRLGGRRWCGILLREESGC